MATCDQIIPGLFIGNYEAALDRSLLDSIGITHIVTAASDLYPEYPGNYVYLHLDLFDMPTQDISKHLKTSADFIENALETSKVLVHCHLGISRSSTIVISYLMQKKGLKFNEAFELTQSRHIETAPNDSFIDQLKKLESFLVFFK